MLKQHELTIFFVLTLLISSAIAGVGAAIGNTDITILTVFGPSLVAIFLTGLVGGKTGIGELLIEETFRRVGLRWATASIFVIPLIGILAVVLHSFFGGPELGLRSRDVFPQVIVIVLIAVGEEYGWRGYALPRLLERFSPVVASVVLGLVWGFWHFPGYLIGVGVPLDMPFVVFLLWVIPGTVLMTWVYVNTRSVLLAIIMHSGANATFNYLPLLPEWVGQLTTFWIFVGLLWGVTGLVAFFGLTQRRRGAEGMDENRHEE